MWAIALEVCGFTEPQQNVKPVKTLQSRPRIEVSHLRILELCGLFGHKRRVVQDSNQQWSSLKITHAHTEELFSKNHRYKGHFKAWQNGLSPLPAALGEIYNKEHFKASDRERERAGTYPQVLCSLAESCCRSALEFITVF